MRTPAGEPAQGTGSVTSSSRRRALHRARSPAPPTRGTVAEVAGGRPRARVPATGSAALGPACHPAGRCGGLLDLFAPPRRDPGGRPVSCRGDRCCRRGRHRPVPRADRGRGAGVRNSGLRPVRPALAAPARHRRNVLRRTASLTGALTGAEAVGQYTSRTYRFSFFIRARYSWAAFSEPPDCPAMTSSRAVSTSLAMREASPQT